MKKGMRGVSLLLVLMLLLGMFPAMSIEVEATAKETWLWPVAGELKVFSNFGYRPGYSYHKGIDISPASSKCKKDPGVAVRATKSGTIVQYCNAYTTEQFKENSFGNYIKIKHDDGTYSLYAHLKPNLKVTSGHVAQGEKIGYIGCSGESYGYHLHFEIYDGPNRMANLLNPMPTQENAAALGIKIQNKYYGPEDNNWNNSLRKETKTRQVYTLTTCSHPQYAFGKCTKCKQPYPGLDSKDYSVAGIYRATEATVYMKSMPYSDKTNKTSKTRGDGIGKGTELRVLYAVKNQYQNIWYYGDVAYVRKLPVTIRFSDNITQPQSFTQRASYKQNLTSGAVTADNGKIRSVQAFFFRAGGSVSDKSCWDRERTDVIPVDKNLYTINSSSKLNLQLTFGNLKAGSYQYGIEAIDSNGEAWYWASRTFTVSPVSQPTVKNCDLRFGQAVAVDGGIRATISSSTPGAKVTVTPAERIIQNSGSSVTVELRYSQTVSASASASGYQTVRGSQTYNVGSCAEPDFYLNETPEGTTVTLTCSTGGASIYYSLDGVTFSPYASPLTLTSTQTVYAYAQKAGCTTSETREQLVSVTAPAAPVLTAGGLGSDVPVGTVLAVSWPEIRNAADYEVTVSVNGVETTQTVTQPQASVTADAAGIYEFQARARNAAGFGDSSQRLRITAHEPSSVRFVNYDGALLTEQSVPWGGAATAPSVPQRRGYTFAGWDRSFRQVTGDLTVTAQYEIKTYTVRFFDYDGETMVHTQKIRFGSGIDSASACAYLSEKALSSPAGGWFLPTRKVRWMWNAWIRTSPWWQCASGKRPISR